MKKKQTTDDAKEEFVAQANIEKKFNLKSFFKKIIDEIVYFFSRIDI